MLKLIQILTVASISVFLACTTAIAQDESATVKKEQKKLKIYVLAGEMGMKGRCLMSTIENRYKDEKMKGDVEFLFKDGAIITRDDVTVVNTNTKAHGKLSTGYGINSKTCGLELAFGFRFGDHHDEDVLIIIYANNRRNLYFDFLSPNGNKLSDELLNQLLPELERKLSKNGKKVQGKEQVLKESGHCYREMLESVRKTVGNLKAHVPNYQGQGYEFAGFVCAIGFNDAIRTTSLEAYRDNMAHFIRDVRKDLKTPNLPFVIAALGYKGSKTEKAPSFKNVLDAQIAVAELEEFKGNVRTVKTSEFWDQEADDLYFELKNIKKKKSKLSEDEQKEALRRATIVGCDENVYYNGAPKYYIGTGRALADAIIEIKKK